MSQVRSPFTLLVAVTVLVLPVVAQDLDPCFEDCHNKTSAFHDALLADEEYPITKGDALRAARIHFADCMEANCGGM